MRVPASARRAAITGLLCVAGLTPLAAQQRPDSTPPASTADTSRAAAPAAPLAGPRVEQRWQRAEQQLVPGTSEHALAQEGRMHTIRLSTLALVLIGVIVLILIVR